MGRVVGIDVGSSAVKAAALQPTGSGYKLKGLAIADIRRQEFYPEDDPQSAVEGPRRALERVVKDRNFTNRPCACSASGPKVAARLFSFPRLNEKEITQAVRFEAEQLIPFDLGEAALDYIVFDDGRSKTEGLAVATHKEEIDKLYNLLKAVHLDPVVFDIDALALANCFLETQGNAQNRVVALINVGARITNLTILHGEDRVFVRDVTTGGDFVSRSISELFGLDLASAEQKKRELMYELEDSEADNEYEDEYENDYEEDYGEEDVFDAIQDDLAHADPSDMILVDDGMASDRTATDLPLGGLDSGEVDAETHARIMDDALGELVAEVGDTFKYYVDKRIVPKIDRVYLTGGTAKLPDLGHFFQEGLGVSTQLWNPLKGVDCSAIAKKFPANFLDEVGPYMGVALGLAMREN